MLLRKPRTTTSQDSDAEGPSAPTIFAADKLLNYGRRLLQPQYWPELRRFAVRRLSSRPTDENTAARARQQCERLAISREQALAALGYPAPSLKPFARHEPARLAAAEMRINAARGGMGGGADIDLLYSLCLALKAGSVVETGVAFGWSSLAILSAIASRPEAGLVSIDLPYLGANLDSLVGLAVPNDLASRWTLLRGADRDLLPGALAAARPVDLAHYDSDKSYLGRRWAYPLIWDSLRDGGILMSDDVEDNLAFLDFASEIGARPLIVSAPHRDRLTGLIRKVAPGPG
jgi:predicted O-methyltransferase YrrM